MRRILTPFVLVLILATAVPGPRSASADALKDLAAGLRARDQAAVDAALEDVIRTGGDKSMKSLLKIAVRVPPQDDGLYWAVVEGCASFVDREGLTTLGEFIARDKKSTLGPDLLYALKRNRSSVIAHALSPVLRDGVGVGRVTAAEHLGHLLTPVGVDALIEVLEETETKKKPGVLDRELQATIVRSLYALTGKPFGANSANWKSWWAQNREKPLTGAEGADSESRTGTAVDFLAGERLAAYKGLEEAPKKGVVVLNATFTRHARVPEFHKDVNNDYMQNVCGRMKIPHTIVNREEFLAFDLSETGVILINCCTFHKQCVNPKHSGDGPTNERLRRCTGPGDHIDFVPELGAEQLEKLQAFVAAGGHVLCEDWVVREFVDKVYPEYVTSSKKLTRSEVDVVPARGRATHDYLEGIFVVEPEDDSIVRLEDLDLDGEGDEDDGGDSGSRTFVESEAKAEESRKANAKLVDVEFHWVIDDESYSMAMPGASRAVMLLSSSKLQAETGDSAVAIAFRPGGRTPVGERAAPGEPGVVLCILSHFGKQGTAFEERTIENLLLNFLIDADAARRTRGEPKAGRRR